MRLKVLTYLHSFEPGGVELDLFRLLRAWCDNGIDARVVIGRPHGALADRVGRLNCTVLQNGRWASEPLESIWMLRHLPRVIRDMRPEIILCPGNGFSFVAVGLWLVLGRKCPPIVHRVSNDLARRDLPWPMRLINQIWQRAQVPAFAAVVGMAEPARAEIAASMGIDASRLFIINNGSLTERDIRRLESIASPVDVRGSGRHYLSVGRLVPQKNFTLLLEAFSLIAGPNDRLTIVGEGSMRIKLEQRARALGISGQLILPGFQNAIDPWLADADAFVLSSNYEGLGNVVIEALAAGLRVIATDCSPNMAALLDGVGTLVPPRDAKALASAMTEALEVQADRRRLHDRARQFTVEANIDRWLQLFDRVASGARVINRQKKHVKLGTCV